jgi:hypothetical protein
MFHRLFTAASVVSLMVMIAAGGMAATDAYRFDPRSTWVLGSRRIYVRWHEPSASVAVVNDPDRDLAVQQQWPLRGRSRRILRTGPFVASYYRWVGKSPAVHATEIDFEIGYGGVAVAGAFLPLGWMISAAYRRRRHEANRFPVETVGACQVHEPGLSVGPSAS